MVVKIINQNICTLHFFLFFLFPYIAIKSKSEIQFCPLFFWHSLLIQ